MEHKAHVKNLHDLMKKFRYPCRTDTLFQIAKYIGLLYNVHDPIRPPFQFFLGIFQREVGIGGVSHQRDLSFHAFQTQFVHCFKGDYAVREMLCHGTKQLFDLLCLEIIEQSASSKHNTFCRVKFYPFKPRKIIEIAGDVFFQFAFGDMFFLSTT